MLMVFVELKSYHGDIVEVTPTQKRRTEGERLWMTTSMAEHRRADKKSWDRNSNCPRDLWSCTDEEKKMPLLRLICETSGQLSSRVIYSSPGREKRSPNREVRANTV